MIQEDEDKLRQFNSDWDKTHSTPDSKPPIDLGKGGTDNISLVESIRGQVANQGVYVPPTIPTTGNKCSECGTIHPPLRPGEECPIAKNKVKPQKAPTSSPSTSPTTHPVQPLTEGKTRGNVKDVPTTPKPISPPRPISPPQRQELPVQPIRHELAPASVVEAEPTPLADNNIPTEIHINKYLNNWGEMIQVHCKKYGITNTKKLMRHLTIEISDFLENYRGK